MKKLLFLLITLVPLLGYSNDFFFNRLNKMYQYDKSKCFKTSKKYMKWFPEKAAPYYFTSIIYHEKSKKSKTVQGEYRNLRQAIGNAMKFEEKDGDQLRDELNWYAYKIEVAKSSVECIEKLYAIDEMTFADALSHKLEVMYKDLSMPDDYLFVKLEDKTEQQLLVKEEAVLSDVLESANNDELEPVDHVTEMESESTSVFVRNPNEFYGIPTGLEKVRAYNVGEEAQLVSLINKERRKKGLEPLEWDENLTKACRYHSYDMATQKYFNHDIYDRTNEGLVKAGDAFQRVKKFYVESFVNNENIAAGNATAESTYQQWFESKEHYDNMFDPDSKKVGVGLIYDEESPFGYYWTLCTAL